MSILDSNVISIRQALEIVKWDQATEHLTNYHVSQAITVASLQMRILSKISMRLCSLKIAFEVALRLHVG